MGLSCVHNISLMFPNLPRTPQNSVSWVTLEAIKREHSHNSSCFHELEQTKPWFSKWKPPRVPPFHTHPPTLRQAGWRMSSKQRQYPNPWLQHRSSLQISLTTHYPLCCLLGNLSVGQLHQQLLQCIFGFPRSSTFLIQSILTPPVPVDEQRFCPGGWLFTDQFRYGRWIYIIS